MPQQKVPAMGPPDARIVVVGEAPGAQEVQEGVPFVGASGNLLRSIMQQSGLLPENIYITNVCKYRPPANNISKYIKLTSRKGVNEHTKAVPNEKVKEGVRELFLDLARIKPNVVVPLGNVALWALTGLTRINKRRGSIMAVTWDKAREDALSDVLDAEFREAIKAVVGMKVYPTFHPSYILRMMHLLPIFNYDIGQVASESQTPELNLPDPEIIIDPEPARLRVLTDELLASELISYDIEVVGGDTLFCCGFACNTDWALTLTPTDPRRLDVIKQILGSEVPKLAQNGIFDATWLKRFSGIVVGGARHDTLVAHAIAYPEFPKGLDFIGSLYTRFPYHKDEGKNWNPRDASDVQRFLEYNAKDVLVTLAAYQTIQREELNDEHHAKTYERVMAQQPVYERMMTDGIQLDVPEMNRLKHEYLREAKRLQAQLDFAVEFELTDQILSATDEATKKKLREFKAAFDKGKGTKKGGLNVNSPKQLKEWLYDILGLPIQTARGSKKPTTNETALKALYARTNDETLLKIWNIREKRKRVSSFLNIKHSYDGRTYFSVMPVKTKTGRSACGKTILGEGINMQTQPHELRTIFIPDQDDYEFAYLDLGQAEARIVAYAGGISRMIRAFETGEDLHRLTASLILGIPYDDVEEYPHRYLGKRCNHAFNYEMGPYKFHDVINDDATETGISITRAEAKKLRQAHLNAYPELQFYWDDIRSNLRRSRTIINPFGRKRVFTGRLDSNTFREAFSHYAQSTVADVLRTGMVRVQDYLATVSPHARVVLEVHDAVLIQYPKVRRDEVVPRCLELMRVPFPIKGQVITIPTDAQVGPNWQDLEKYHAG